MLSMGLAAAASIIIFVAFEENEREEAQAWMQATVIQVADRIDVGVFLDDEVQGGIRIDSTRIDEVTAIMRDSRSALIRELDAAHGLNIAGLLFDAAERKRSERTEA